MKIHSNISSLTCTITLGGEPIGGLQDFTFTENYNTKQVNSLGRAYSNTFVSGFFNGEIRAKRVFISNELLTSVIMHDTTSSISAKKYNSGVFSLNDESTINESFRYVAPSNDYDDLIYSIFYDFVISDSSGNIICKLTDCIMDQRTTSISISNVTIMEDVVFKFKSVEKQSHS